MHAYWSSYASDESGHYIWNPASPSYCYVLVDNTYYFKVSDMVDNYKNGIMGFNVDSAGHIWDDAKSRGGWHYNDTLGTHDFKVLAPISGQKQTHNWTTTTEPTCTTTGTQVCTVCGYSRSLSALGHSWGNNYESSRTNATCTTNGTIYYSHKCNRCGTIESNGTSNINALDHAWGNNYESSRTNATCTTNGTIYYSHKCSRCGNVESNGTSTIPKLGHNFNKTDTSSSRQISTATHNQPSKYYYSCGICGASYSGNYSATRDKVSTGAKEECYHIATNHWSYSVSKDSPGQGCFWYGTRTKHNWSDAVTTAPTVYATGVRTFTCGSDYIHVTEPKLQFRVFLGNTRINLNSL